MIAFTAEARSWGQVSTEEANQKLQEKQKQREAERGASITITRGELDDPKAQIARLQAENATSRQQLAQGSAAVKRAPAPDPKAAPQPARKKDPPASIEIGMSREDVLAFVEAHPQTYRIEGASVNSPQRRTVSETTITRQTSVDQGSDAPPRTTTQQTQTVRVHQGGDKREHLRITTYAPRDVVVGQRRRRPGARAERCRNAVAAVGLDLDHAGQ